jgi:hypothetical protein
MEGLAEVLFTGAFKKSQAKMQPVVIARELVKIMHKHKRISVSQVYVPNVYRVFLHPDDWGPLASFGASFLLELSKYVYHEGRRFGYTFLTKPAIELHADAQTETYQMAIEVDFDDTIDLEWQDDEDDAPEAEDRREQTNILREEARSGANESADSSRNQQYYLEVIEGGDLGQRYLIPVGESFLGRHSQCAMSVADPEVSRRHLKLTVDAQGWMLDDLGSTNGTWVNGQRITRQAIAPGDRIQIGQTVLMLKRLPEV